ncbi:iron complex outermembrane receptor protein [Lutibacter sp. Hel_I_33_5]|uniref:TonB-dependent receptor domain-containing protein n=1 Tax=Lutibacter sp. Hel_I_33_5 TaxID=1566289 RepID=UPI00119E4CBF|nr:TonB-dependent receptor [Lutibacter sp. Hel_I_33_5]TVZ57292.1 iron complex outermembrane receptor protein [Lutibacter sp. Hel_I_33_5]
MKTKKHFRVPFLTWILLLSVSFVFAQSTVTGSVSDDSGPLPGVNIIIEGTSTGTSTDFNGNFKLKSNESFPWTLVFSYTGYESKSIVVNNASQTLNVVLEGGSVLDEVVVSASRRRQKVQEAPASVSLLTSKDLENSASAVDPVRQLINTPGVQIQQQSANSLNIEMRAGSGVFGTSTFPILDYRYLVTPSAGLFLSYQTGMSNIDIDKIEVVRGAASALYGPGVTSGVVHFLSKSAIDKPGTTVEFVSGTLSTYGTTLRHATASKDEKFGFKINMRYMQGDDFELDAVTDAAFIAGQKTTISQPVIKGGRVDPSQAAKTLLTLADLDDNGDGNPLATEYRNYSANMHFEFRPNEKTNAVVSAGLANGNGLFFNSQGAGYTQGNDYWAQARIQRGGLFAQVYYNYNDGGDEENPTFLYASGLRQIAKRSSIEAQLQYNFDTPNFLDTNFTVGADYRNSASDSEGTLYGINEDDDQYVITGIYMQGTSKLSDKLDLTYAGRYDKYNFINEGAFAPRVALVYKAGPKTTFRASYNVATFGPSALEQNIDFPVSIVAPGVLDVWLSGQKNAQTFVANPTIDLSIPGLPDLPYGATSFPLAYVYGAVAQPTIAGINAALAGNPLLPVVNNFLSTYVPSGSTGTLEGYNLFNGEAMNELTPTLQSRIGKLNSFEVGYKGLIGDKLSVGLDVYTYSRKGFTQFTAVAPTFRLTGANFANDLSARVGADFAADPNVVGAITAGVLAQVQGVYASNGWPLAGIPGVVPSAAATAAAQTPGAIATAAAQVGGAFAQGGAGFASNVAPLLSVIGAVETSGVPQGDGITHIPAGYRIFDNVTRSHFGSDLALKYFANDSWTLWGNASWVSQTEWIPGQSNDDGLPFSSYLNSPKFKYRVGAQFNQDKWRGGLAFQHDDGFNSNQGLFSGPVQEKNLVDLNVGYSFNKKIKLDLSATNVFNNEYRAFPNMPVIGRRVVLRTTVDF